MRIKSGFIVIYCSLLLTFFGSCLDGDDDPVEYTVSTDAQIVSFSLSHDSISELKTVVFSIDQANGLIYNHDSMTYKTNVFEKVIVSYSSDIAGNVLNVTDGDSTWVTSGDSLDMSKPQRLKVFALDGITTKFYNVKLNIHQIDPDSMQYIKMGDDQSFLNTKEVKSILFDNYYYIYTRSGSSTSLHRSADMLAWSEVPMTGFPSDAVVRGIQTNGQGIFLCTETGDLYGSYDAFSWNKFAAEYPVVTILGYLNKSAIQSEGLALVVRKDDSDLFAFTSDLLSWSYGNKVSESFPLSDFSSVNNSSALIERLTIIGGLSAAGDPQNTVWSTQDGLYWAKLTSESSVFPKMYGANSFIYDEELYLLNGKLADGKYNEELYYSIDGGATWKTKPNKYLFADNYKKRSGASLVIDGQGAAFYIIGGENDNNILPDIWRGMQNEKRFKN